MLTLALMLALQDDAGADRLIRALADESIEARERAASELAALGPRALRSLDRAARDKSAEVRGRVEDVLKEIARRTAAALSDAELDAIIAAKEWPAPANVEKTRAAIVIRSTVPRDAAARAIAALMKKHGLDGAAKDAFDWYEAGLDAGFAYGARELPAGARRAVLAEVPWSATVPMGRDDRTAAAQREGLRAVAVAAAAHLVRWAADATPERTIEALAERGKVRK